MDDNQKKYEEAAKDFAPSDRQFFIAWSDAVKEATKLIEP